MDKNTQEIKIEKEQPVQEQTQPVKEEKFIIPQEMLKKHF